MGREIEVLELGGRKYTVQQLPAMRAHKLLFRLAKLAGPALGSIAGAMGEGDGLKDLDFAKTGQALGLFFDRATEADLESLTKELLADALVDGQTLMPQFDAVFRGDILGLYRVLGFALKVNFGSFSAALGAVGISLHRRGPSPSATSATSAGPQSA